MVERDVADSKGLAAIKVSASDVTSAMRAAFVAGNGNGSRAVGEDRNRELAVGIAIENFHVGHASATGAHGANCGGIDLGFSGGQGDGVRDKRVVVD
jgi:hypothetical protein